jgi:hypothetical protein
MVEVVVKLEVLAIAIEEQLFQKQRSLLQME